MLCFSEEYRAVCPCHVSQQREKEAAGELQAAQPGDGATELVLPLFVCRPLGRISEQGNCAQQQRGQFICVVLHFFENILASVFMPVSISSL